MLENKYHSEQNFSEVNDKVGRKYQVQIFEDPRNIGEADKLSLIKELTPLTGLGFMRQDIYAPELAEDVANHVLNCHRLLVARSGNEISAFVAVSLINLDNELVYHIEGAICHPKFESTGLSRTMLADDLKTVGADTIAFHTQSMKMLQLGLSLAKLNEKDSLRLADSIGTRNQDGIVDRKRYGGTCLYGDVERFSRIALPFINYLEGDALICAGPVRK